MFCNLLLLGEFGDGGFGGGWVYSIGRIRGVG